MINDHHSAQQVEQAANIINAAYFSGACGGSDGPWRSMPPAVMVAYREGVEDGKTLKLSAEQCTTILVDLTRKMESTRILINTDKLHN